MGDKITFSERLKTRIPSLRHFAGRARTDSRNIAYDLLPVLGLGQRQALVQTLSAFAPKTPGLKLSARARALLEQLREEGVTDMQPAIDPGWLADLVTYFKATPCHDPYRPHLGSFRWDAPPSDEINIGYYSWNETLRAPHMAALMNQPDILAVAEAYMGCKPVIDNIGITWSYPGRETAKSVQRFHRDYDCARNFKAFYYLTDVDEASGPHRFVRGSHRDRRLDTGRAQTDEAIAATFGEASIARITGPAGSWFLEDVYGFHKGQLPVDEPRLLLAIEYNLYPSPFCPRGSERLPLAGRDPYINKLVMA
ncbi:phytanoyl-CoA dioxygenase [Asticcacaulis sp. EMRT-3]|uniref:phytanoyl-CoA dioxygenase n=1 Tax=Asticcacaulis sp. EMRT-3 TaxID=3040349 RepID=UPI0024AF5EEA|nr:phytanoyl-CoA dioxygenase [Asticcacaulis sp. EMRT-3]MDI7776131.1 phytanoyl-CoA dioxygenase [Asticcacaulis sp. EMRT-3]